jgi:hypothetical protein
MFECWGHRKEGEVVARYDDVSESMCIFFLNENKKSFLGLEGVVLMASIKILTIICCFFEASWKQYKEYKCF